MRLPLMRSCREAARLISEREERPLGWGESLALRLHLRICDACPRFERQVRVMREAMAQWRRDRDAGDDGGEVAPPPLPGGGRNSE